MKKILALFIFFTLLPVFTLQAETFFSEPTGITIKTSGETATISWKNPVDPLFAKNILFKSSIPIPIFFSYEAIKGICDKIYEGQAETYTDTGLAVNLPYYYVLFAFDQTGNISKPVMIEKKLAIENTNTIKDTLAGASARIVNQTSLSEAEIIYNYNGSINTEMSDNSRRLALFIIVKSPNDLSEKDKDAISFFIHTGTPTTILLGAGERTGVLNSYLSAFNKLPKNVLEWQDIIKIANGRWPAERNEKVENNAADVYFNAIYERKPDMNNPNDNAAVTVIAYGLRPAGRNMESEKKAIEIYRAIFGNDPSQATDWDLIRAIAYSGATR